MGTNAAASPEHLDTTARSTSMNATPTLVETAPPALMESIGTFNKVLVLGVGNVTLLFCLLIYYTNCTKVLSCTIILKSKRCDMIFEFFFLEKLI